MMTAKPHIMVIEARFYEDLSDASGKVPSAP